MSALCWLNGQKTTTLPVMDRSVQYGDGFFTTLLVIEGKVYNWAAHWQRIQNSALRLGFPKFVENDILNLLASVLAGSHPDMHIVFKSEQACCFNQFKTPLAIKLVFSRGEGGRGYQALTEPKPNTLLYINPHPQFEQACDFTQIQKSIELGLCETFCAIQPQLAGLKHLNRLENVLARNELQNTPFIEGLMLNLDNEVVCATQSNVFMIKDQLLMTPNLEKSGVAGTTRMQMHRIAQMCGLQYQEQTLSLASLHNADELFLTNALRGVMPIKQFQNRAYASKQTLEIHNAWVKWQGEHALSLTLEGVSC